MKILGLIPARGGSKGVKRKNIKLLGGKPLIQFTIDEALKCSFLSKVVVSTEDEEIASISKSLGADVPELRPEKFARDDSPTIDTLVYTLDYYKSIGEFFDYVVLLQPTCPFRGEGDISRAIQKIVESEFDSLVSVLEVPKEYNPYWVYISKNENTLELAINQEQVVSRRQDLPDCYIRSGDIYITKADVILNQRSIYGKRVGFYKMDSNNHVNIDTMEDWRKAELIIKDILNAK